VPDSGTIVLYVLSTLAQTCAALAAFVGAVGVFRLQTLRDQHRDAERELRACCEGLSNRNAFDVTLSEVRGWIKKHQKPRSDHPSLPRAEQAEAHWLAFGPGINRSRDVLVVFELWNLFVIAASLVGFNYVQGLASWRWTPAVLWIAATGTVGVTLGCVVAWTKQQHSISDDDETPMIDTRKNPPGEHAAQKSARDRRVKHWLDTLYGASAERKAVWLTGAILLATIAYTVVSYLQLNEFQASNERAQRAWMLVDSVTLDRFVPNADLQLTVFVKNYGKSPASKVTVHAGPIISPTNPKDLQKIDATYSEQIQSRSLAGPDRVVPSNFTIRFTDAQYKDVQTGATVYILGRISYVDTFVESTRRNRETTFCAFLERDKFLECRIGNHAD
jgi:hypothetical protein